MKILILGAGVVGVTSAYFLALEGHEVTVVERESAPAEQTSFGNAGQISPGYSGPWASASVPWQALKWMFVKHSPLILRPGLDMRLYRWLFQFLRNCTNESYRLNKARMVPLAEYSRDCLAALRSSTGISYDERMRGTLQLFRTQKQMDSISRDVAVLQQFGVTYEILDKSGCSLAEPALALVEQKFVGGLRLPDDETGDCNIFTKKLAALASARGVKFLFEKTITHLVADGGQVGKVMLSDGELVADSYVVAMGSYSPLLLESLGIRIPVYPVKGYSITLPIENTDGAPVSTVLDESNKIAVTRLGNRIRAGGRVELTGYDGSLLANRRAALEHCVQDLFPTASNLSKASFWAGLRPMTPDGTPIIGATPYPNLFLNTGHGTLGWTMSCGSARILADIISSRKPDISYIELGVARYNS